MSSREPANLIAMQNGTELVEHTHTPDAWGRFVACHPSGTVFNTIPMIEAYRATPRHDVLAIGAVDCSGEFLAQVVSVATATMRGLASRFSTRAIMYGTPLCRDSPQGREALRRLLGLVDARMQKTSLFSEIRLHNGGDLVEEEATEHGYEHSPFLNFLVDVTRPEDQLWSSIGKQTRGKIRRSQSRGVVVERGESEASIASAYKMIQASFRYKAVPLVDRELFHAALRNLPAGAMQVRLAKVDGKTVAASIGLVYRDRYYAWYGGTTRPKGIDPFALIVWDEISWCHQNGLAIYDFGGAGAPGQEYGPRIFKSRFHGEAVNFGRYRKVYSEAKLALAERGYRFLSQLLSRKRTTS